MCKNNNPFFLSRFFQFIFTIHFKIHQMRIIFLLLTMTLALNSFSQKTNSRVLLSKGQKFTARITSTGEADMGMGMAMKNNTTFQNNFYVMDATDKNYSISNTLTGVKIFMDLMGQEMKYDSDLKEDSASDMAKAVKNLNIPDTVTVDISTGVIISHKKNAEVSKDDASNPVANIFESFSNDNVNEALSEAFFIIPEGKKAGDSWMDSSLTKDKKTIRSYMIRSIDKKNMAVISLSETETSNTQTETQGMQLTIDKTTKSDIEIIADTKTSLVSKRTTKSDITSSVEVMGQTAPITGKMTTTAVYEY